MPLSAPLRLCHQSKPSLEATLDFRSDIYAVGVIAYHIISGQLPYDGENSMVILRKLIAEPTPDIREPLPPSRTTHRQLHRPPHEQRTRRTPSQRPQRRP